MVPGPVLREVRITTFLPCLADPEKLRVVAEFSDDIREVLPYLNAVLLRAIYNPLTHTLTFQRDGRLITLYPHVVTMAKVWDEQDAHGTAHWLRELINDTWRRRSQIPPCYERRAVLQPLDVYQLLPRSNCGRCGELTCLAFAIRLAQGAVGLAECPVLVEREHEEKRRRLEELLGGGDTDWQTQ
jgi:ArsR family metal-binding transcriptional regulator